MKYFLILLTVALFVFEMCRPSVTDWPQAAGITTFVMLPLWGVYFVLAFGAAATKAMNAVKYIKK